MSERQDLQPSYSRCFRCTEGCIHLACGNVTLTLTPTEFLVLAEAISAMRQQLKEEVRCARQSGEAETDFFAM